MPARSSRSAASCGACGPESGRRAVYRRVVTLVGEQAQVDWGSFGKVHIGHGTRTVSGFVMVLGYSRALAALFTLDQTLESFLRGHVDAFEALGGAARNLVYDNLRSAVLDRRGTAVQFHPRLLDLAGHYHFAPRPCTPGRGNEPLEVELVREPAQRLRFRELVGRYHYLGHTVPFGAHLRYLVFASRPQRAVVGCLQFSSPAWRMAVRDRWVGWDDRTRARNLQHVVNNSRFLLLPWVGVKNLASAVLARGLSQLAVDWPRHYRLEPWLVETCFP